jgi:hypothetical protein
MDSIRVRAAYAEQGSGFVIVHSLEACMWMEERASESIRCLRLRPHSSSPLPMYIAHVQAARLKRSSHERLALGCLVSSQYCHALTACKIGSIVLHGILDAQ